MNPESALAKLLEGNRRYVGGESARKAVTAAERNALTGGQSPHAIVFSCVDSRVPPEIVFDAGLGDLLVIRTAGHVVDDAALGSIEFGVAELGIPLIMILGHTSCGAVTAASHPVGEEGLPGKIGVLAEALQPAIQAAQVLGGKNLIDTAVAVNVRFTVDRLMASPVIAAAVKSKKLMIAGAVYDLASGETALVDSDVENA